MAATVNAKRACLRSDGIFFVEAETLTGEFDRGDTLLVPAPATGEVRVEIDRIYYVANNSGAQPSLMFKNLTTQTQELLKRTVGKDCILVIE